MDKVDIGGDFSLVHPSGSDWQPGALGGGAEGEIRLCRSGDGALLHGQ